MEDTAAEGSQGPSSADRFECMVCEKNFATKRGLGMHFRSKHPVEYHAKALEELKGKKEVKKRWTNKKVNMMARAEAEIMLRLGPTENINQELKKVLKERTIEAIKGKRRAEKYKRMVRDIYASIVPGTARELSPSSSSSLVMNIIQDQPAQTENKSSPTVDL